MKTTSVTLLKNSLSAQLKEVASGETILITDRRKPVASLQPLAHGELTDDLSDLYAQGIVAPPKKPFSVGRFLQKPRGESHAELSSAILEERQER
jgi:antitoxin (DNA-binding transcriptional repressor) of toxin-antitoxin stability system